MRIKKLEIFGFKSFADRVVIDFDSGVTGIVGPNGCGKSNVVDALRWVMGEQSAKDLRGDNMQDIIFNGSQTRGPLGMAEAVLTLENDGQQTVPDYAHFSEIEIARRLYKTGDSEYEINKRPCRLKDITELFLGTGVGTKAYSIIEQGRVSNIVQSKPEERRQIIEEAAGITKYKARRLAAERKMESTEQNLLRIGDILREVEGRLSSLEKQAQKAEKYHQLQKEIKEIDLHHSVLRFLELANRMRHLELQYDERQGSANEFQARISEYETLIERLRFALSDDEKQLSLSQGMLYEAENVIALSKQDIQFATSNLEQKHKQTIFINEETRRLEEKTRQLQINHTSQVEEKTNTDAELVDLESKLHIASDELKALNETRLTKSKLIETSRSLFMKATSQSARASAEIHSLKNRYEDAKIREQTLQKEKESKQNHLSEKQNSTHLLEAEVSQKKTEHQHLQNDLQSHLEKQKSHDTLLKDLETQKRQINEEMVSKQSRLKSLQEIEQSFDFGSDGLARIMKEKNTGAIVGLVAEFLEVPTELEQLVEDVLKHRLEAVIVKDNNKMRHLASDLAQSKDGQVRFYVEQDLSLISPAYEQNISLPVGGFFLIDQLNILACNHLVQRILGNIAIVATMQDALDFWPTAMQKNITLVTQTKELLETDGSLVSGIQAKSSGILKRKREIRSLSDELEILKTKHDNIENTYQEQANKKAVLTQNIETVKATVQNLAIQLACLEQNFKTEKNYAENLANAVQRLEQETERNAQLMQKSLGDLARFEAELVQAQNNHQQLETELASHNELLQILDKELAVKNEETTTLRVKVASLREKQTNLSRQLAQNTEQQADVQRQMRSLSNQLTQASEDQTQLLIQKETAEEKIIEAQKERDILASNLQHKRAQYEHQLGHVREKEATVNTERKQLDQIKDTLNKFMLGIQEAQLAEEALSERLFEKYRTKPHKIVHDYHHLPMPDFDFEKRLKELQKSVDYLGNINPNAMTEFNELQERYNFLKTQNDDLHTALEQLQSAIGKINETTIQRFSQAFETINERFSQVFPRLFKGGKAWLELTNPNDLLTSGVEIYAQPPGKKLGSIALMSGGEKALTATSLIFAIFLIKPSPFCLLDEVDAPLDEANVDRFSAMVKELSKISQFIVITHNKRTMAVTDQLYGITMEQPGISKTVHVKVADTIDEEAPSPKKPDPYYSPDPV